MTHEPRCLRGTARPPPRLEVADIVRVQGEAFTRSHALSIEQRRALRAIARCRSAALGGHLEVCTACGEQRPAYNSCRNRHCPKCQALPQARWVERQMERVLPVTCFHVVFTLPAELRPLARRHGRHLYELLLRSASSTLLTLGRDRRWLGAELGITAVLHTWARDLSLHPHAHCIVTAGGLSLDGGRWVDAQGGFLFPVAVLARLFRGRFLGGLCRLRRTRGVGRHLGADAFDALLRQLYATDWNVYCKAPLRRARADLPLPGPVHSPRRHHQPPPAQLRWPAGHLSHSRCRHCYHRRPDLPRALSVARPAPPLRKDPSLRAARQRPGGVPARACSAVAHGS